MAARVTLSSMWLIFLFFFGCNGGDGGTTDGGAADGGRVDAGGGRDGEPPGCAAGTQRCAGNAIEVCAAGTWVQAATCPAGNICEAGQCVLAPCEPACDGRACGDDGCGAACGECPAQSACEGGQCVAAPACGDGTCGNDEDCERCPRDCGCTGDQRCEGGRCVEVCTPDCAGRTCGADGCGSSCGDCTGAQVCDGAGRCGDRPVACGDGVCDLTEDCGTCVDDCACRAGERCQDNACVEVCVPDCNRRICGDDGCGGTCGDCPADQVCDGAGRCIGVPDDCGDQACNNGEDCGTCPADCACEGGELCRRGVCEAEPSCGDGICNVGEDCVSCLADCPCAAREACSRNRRECVCVPDCEGRACGPDGCGGVCGECGNQQACDNGRCVAACDGSCGAPWAATCSGDGFAYLTCLPGLEVPECTELSRRIPCGEDRQCANGACGGACLAPEVMVLIDRSSSMLAGGRWDFARTALEDLAVRYGAGARLGLRLLPGDRQGCEPGDIRPPAFNNVATFRNLPDPAQVAQTPLAAALTGLEAAFGDPDEGEAVVLITDGDETCADADAVIAQVTALRRRGVRTYAVGISQQANGDLLTAIAVAGGTARPNERAFYLVRDGAELQAALGDVLTRLESCVCQAGDVGCEGDQRLACSADRRTFAAVENCPNGCGDGACFPTCRPGAWSCVGADQRVCADDGQGYSDLEACEWNCEPGVGCRAQRPIDYCRLQFPLEAQYRRGEVFGVYGIIYHAGVTDRTVGVDRHPRILVQLAFAPRGTPENAGGWAHNDAAPNFAWNGAERGEPNNDEYAGMIAINNVGEFDLVVRVTTDGGRTYTLCDANGSIDGYQPENAGRITIVP